MREDILVLAGRPVGRVADSLRRYCGLTWSGGEPETWAYRYYDLLPDETPQSFRPVDLLAASALHPGLSKDDLAWFADNTADLDHWLAETPNTPLADADEDVLRQVRKLPDLADATRFGLLTKVLHRKRPNLLLIAERRLVDWYRPITGERSAIMAWPALVECVASDLRDPANRNLLEAALADIAAELPVPISLLRAADVSLWMEGEK